METPKTRNGSSEVPKKVSPRVARQLKVNSVAFGSSSPASPSTNATRTPKDRSPKVLERKSPRSPAVTEKKRPSRGTELESQISELQDDLKKVKEQLITSKKSKEEAEVNAEELKHELAAVSFKLEESQKQLSKFCDSKEDHFTDLKGISEEKDRAWENQLEIIRKQQLIDASALASSLEEIETLKQQLEMVTRCEDAENESTDIELQILKENLKETLLILENMKTEIIECKQSEAQARELVQETLDQLEEAKQAVIDLRHNGMKANEAYGSVASELENSRARVTFLEGLVNELNAKLVGGDSKNVVLEGCRDEVDELVNLRSEVRVLKDEYSASSMKQAELEAELQQTKSAMEELKGNLMDKENELQAITEENEALNTKLKRSITNHEDNELDRLRDEISDLQENLTHKETELQCIIEDNKMLKSAVENRLDDSTEEKETSAKLEAMMEEAEKSKRRAERAAEQLESAQAGNAELEAELRKLKVQSDQWRKAAEAAASMLSSPNGNGRFVERTGSLDNSNGFSPMTARMGSPYLDDYDDEDAFKKKNGNVLRKIGGFWKKPHK